MVKGELLDPHVGSGMIVSFSQKWPNQRSSLFMMLVVIMEGYATNLLDNSHCLPGQLRLKKSFARVMKPFSHQKKSFLLSMHVLTSVYVITL